MYKYDEEFYQYINQGSIDSARELIPALLGLLPLTVKSVLDVGCGAGAWLSVWKSQGCEVLGLDGAYVERAALLVAPDEFREQDLVSPFSLGRRFDIAQCLEVAEHLPASRAEAFVAALCEHADVVLFSAAAPGQGGENHINEQPYSYWRDLFEGQNYQMYDPLRASMLEKSAVKPWYKYNTFVYLKRGAVPEAHQALANWIVHIDTLPQDVSPLLYRFRKQLIGVLPPASMTVIAKGKKAFFNALGGRRAP